ncbi:MAG: type IV secretion system DNA-binding domain-containing protein, partial [Patescibacteria group bacterium]
MPRIHDHENEITYFARTNHRGHARKFGIKTDDRRRHMYIIGKTGMGKTTLIENMVLQDIYNGHGVAYIDPHGDTVEKILNYIPSWRINDIVYMNPADLDYPIGFNVLEAVSQTQKHLLSAGLMSVFKKIWEGLWSARMEYILSNTILELMDTPGTTLLAVNRMYSDADFRKMVVTNIKDPIVKQFWVMEYAAYSEKFATEAVAAIQNKIGQFITSGLIRNIIGQVTSTIDIRQLMDSQKIFLVNLSKGRIGEDNMRLLGGMIIAKIQLAAMDRVDMPEHMRKDYYLYVDEFQNFATESFAAILSEARKFRLNLIVAHQYIAQLTEEVRDAVLGNVGSLVLFRVGAPDGLTLEPEMAPRFLVEDIINLPKFQIYLKLMIDGVASAPFSAATLPPIARVTESEPKVIRVSRERYARNRDEIEERIADWTGIAQDANIDELMEQAKARGTGNPPK